ncbi:methyltransferase domain-containing protein [Cupriavidus sp. NPDC089707]|uniref:methyltransferase domain-containing protein n=1 Tax=Cupriavidus sp. NPDC089707 TaxID=3363963 RepID=UPI00380ECCAA
MKTESRKSESLLSDAEIERIRLQMQGDIASPHNVKLLSRLSIAEREYFSLKSKTVVLYLGDEVGRLTRSEEEAVMRAAPPGYPLRKLNGLNVGCGARTVSPYLMPVDIMREATFGARCGEHQALNKTAFLANPTDLPFRAGSLDLIVSLHMLEHLEDPIDTIIHWLYLLKPGGGIGIVVPDWRYTWDSRNDHAPLSHKWNPTPSLIKAIYETHWKPFAELEQLCSYDMKLSFDFVLRKYGEFVPFSPPDVSTIRSGATLHSEGVFLSDETFGSVASKDPIAVAKSA